MRRRASAKPVSKRRWKPIWSGTPHSFTTASARSVEGTSRAMGFSQKIALPRAGRRLDLLGMGARRGDDHDGLHLAIEDGLAGVRDGPRAVAGAQLPGGRRRIGDDREVHLRKARQGAGVRGAEAARAQERDAEPTARPSAHPPARGDTGHTTSTRSPRTPSSSSTMLVTTQQWLGTTWTTSPTLGRSGTGERSTTPCSSERPVIDGLRVLHDVAVALHAVLVGGEHLRAAVEDGAPVGGAAHHRGAHAHRAVRPRSAVPERDHHRVVEDAGARAVLGQHREVLDAEEGRRAAARHHRHRDARPLEQLERALEEDSRVSGSRLGNVMRPWKSHPRQLHDRLRQVERGLRASARRCGRRRCRTRRGSGRPARGARRPPRGRARRPRCRAPPSRRSTRRATAIRRSVFARPRML